jgi:TRAP transporter TAXI family solute receptor
LDYPAWMLRDLLWSDPSTKQPRVTPNLNTRRSHLIVALFAIVIAIAVATGVWSVIASGIPPRTVTLATGPEGSAYAQIGERYRAILARSGVDLNLRATAGSVENLAKLRDPRSGVSAGFAISGLSGAKEASELETLGTIYYQPLWLFERASTNGLVVEGLAGKRVSFGSEGSGTRALTTDLLALAGIDPRRATLLDLPPTEAADGLLRREVDAVALVDSWDTPLIRRLVAAPEISLVTFRRADALVALRPHLNKLILPTGVGDLAANRPPSDVVLIAPKASLVVRRDLHDAIQFLLLDAAAQIHSGPGIFHRAGAFPAAESIDFPLSGEAIRFYKSGRPFLQRYLPFWIAVLAERLLFLLVPLVGIVLPLIRVVPDAYRGIVQRRIIALYGELKVLETELEARGPGASRTDLIPRLDALERRAAQLRVPLRFSQILYTLKVHIRMVRDRLASRE